MTLKGSKLLKDVTLHAGLYTLVENLMKMLKSDQKLILGAILRPIVKISVKDLMTLVKLTQIVKILVEGIKLMTKNVNLQQSSTHILIWSILTMNNSITQCINVQLTPVMTILACQFKLMGEINLIIMMLIHLMMQEMEIAQKQPSTAHATTTETQLLSIEQ